MSNIDFVEILLPDCLDNIIEDVVTKAIKEKRKKKIRIIFASAAVFISFILTLATINPAMAANVPLLKNVFSMIEKNVYFAGDYSSHATEVNKKVSSKGINVTLSEILCDGESLYVTYIVESNEPFAGSPAVSNVNDIYRPVTQLIVNTAYDEANFSNKQLDKSGLSGLEGSFIDNKTFVGMQEYNLTALETKIPDEFTFKVKITNIPKGTNAIADRGYTTGNWSFDVPVKVDRTLAKTIVPSTTPQNGYKIESIIITPYEMKVKASIPSSTDNQLYFAKVFDDNDNEILFTHGYLLGLNKLYIFKAPPKDCKKLRIELYDFKYPEGSTQNGTKEELLNETVNIN